MNLLRCAVLVLGVATSFHTCFGALTMIAIRNTPKSADAIIIAADGLGIVTPLLGTLKPDGSGDASVTVVLPDVRSLRAKMGLPASADTQMRFRAIALRHHGSSLFPLITALAGRRAEAGGTVVLDFAKSIPLAIVGAPIDFLDGTLVIPITLSGVAEFFAEGQIVNLWISHAQTSLIGAGDLFYASLTPGSDSSIFTAIFKIPIQAAAGQYQVGFYALQFQEGAQIPLLLIPSNASQNAIPQISTNPLLPSTEESALGTHSSTPSPRLTPGTYNVIVGPDGHFIRQLK